MSDANDGPRAADSRIWECDYCGASELAVEGQKSCPRCGAPRDPAARSLEEGARTAPAAAKAATSASPRGCLVVGVIALLLVANSLFCSGNARLTLVGHSWERSIAIERLETRPEEGWCDRLPSGARELTRTTRQRGTRRVPDGVLTRAEPVYDDYCTFEAATWVAYDSVEARGDGLTPRWPTSGLSPCSQVGCTREGERSARYLLELEDGSGERHRCSVPEPRWRGAERGSRWRARTRRVTRWVDCGSLQAD